MKKLFYLLAVVLISAMSFTSCTDDEPELPDTEVVIPRSDTGSIIGNWEISKIWHISGSDSLIGTLSTIIDSTTTGVISSLIITDIKITEDSVITARQLNDYLINDSIVRDTINYTGSFDLEFIYIEDNKLHVRTGYWPSDGFQPESYAWSIYIRK